MYTPYNDNGILQFDSPLWLISYFWFEHQLGLSSPGWFDLTKWLDKLLNLKFLVGIKAFLLDFRLVWDKFWLSLAFSVKIGNNGREWSPTCIQNKKKMVQDACYSWHDDAQCVPKDTKFF